MNDRALPVTTSANVPALAMNEQELMSVLQNSLYPGAKIESIKLVIGYCKAAGLDPMQKPVHIVPMSVKTGRKGADGWDEKEMRDVVMPGIGLYRTQAARSGEYAGVTEPEFGDDVDEVVGETRITYPKWCRVTVKRQMANGAIVEFTAKELWKENYATKSTKAQDPNAMWKRRPYAQLAKCAEAQALRKAFPEFGAAPTAEEMDGKEMMGGEGVVIDQPPPKPAGPQPYPAEQFTKNLPAWKSLIASGKKTADQIIATVSSKAVLSDEQKKQINAIKAPEVDPAFVADMEKAA